MRRPLNKVRLPREGGEPVSYASKPLDPRLRGEDGAFLLAYLHAQGYPE